MNFLSPLFLGGLAALAVPVLIHLINRERKTVVEFPSLMFLQKIPYRSVRRQKLRHILLLILRCIAIAIIVAAFARPFFDRARNAAAATTGARDVVIAVDRSYSMGYGSRWTRAQDSARAVIRALRPGDRGTVVLFANEPTAATQPTSEKVRLERALQSAKLSSEGTKYAPAVKLAAQILGASQLPRRELVLISDFQQRGWANREEMGLPKGTTMRAIDVSNGAAADAAVSTVSTDRDRDTDRARVTVAARLTNVAEAPRRVDAVLELGGRVVETKQVEIPAKGATQVRFSTMPVPAAATRGLVRITGDSLPQNDRFQFTISPDEAVSVLVVEPATPRGNQSLYLRGALGIVERPAFKVDVKRSDALAPTDFDARSLVILNEAAPPGGALGARLRELVRAGGGLLIVPGEQDVTRWPAEWRDSIPATIGPVVDRSTDAGATVATLDYSTPVFEVFSAPRSGDFTAARVFRYRTLTPRGDSGVIARFDDARPAMIQRGFGFGKIAIWATSLDASWTDLPLQPVFVPFVHQIGRNIGRFSDARSWFTAGDVLDLSRQAELAGTIIGTRAGADTVQLVLESPSGERTRLSQSGASHLAPLREHGFYELRGASTPVGSGRPIAVNVDPAESDLSHLDPAELVAATLAGDAVGEGSAQTLEPIEQERRQTLWWYLLLLGLLLLAVETVWSNRLSKNAGAELAAAPLRPPLRRV
jgi:hypothetical protein